MRRIVLCLTCCALAFLASAQPSSPPAGTELVRRIWIGGGPSDADGGAYFSEAGDAWLSGDLTVGGETISSAGAGRLRYSQDSGAIIFTVAGEDSSSDVDLLLSESPGITYGGGLTYDGQGNRLDFGTRDGSTAWVKAMRIDRGSQDVQVIGDLTVTGGDVNIGGAAWTSYSSPAQMHTTTRIWAGSTPVLLTNWAGNLQVEALEQDGANTGSVLEWDGSEWHSTTMDETILAQETGEGTLMTITSGKIEFYCWNLQETVMAGAYAEATFEIELPADYGGGALNADVYFTTPAAASGAGENIYLSLVGYARNGGDNLNVDYPTDDWFTTGDVSTTAYDIHTHTKASFTITGTKQDASQLYLRLRRDPDHASDDFSGLVYVTKIRIYE